MLAQIEITSLQTILSVYFIALWLFFSFFCRTVTNVEHKKTFYSSFLWYNVTQLKSFSFVRIITMSLQNFLVTLRHRNNWIIDGAFIISKGTCEVIGDPSLEEVWYESRISVVVVMKRKEEVSKRRGVVSGGNMVETTLFFVDIIPPQCNSRKRSNIL